MEMQDRMYAETKKISTLDNLIDDVFHLILDKLDDQDVYTLSTAYPYLLERFPRIEWIQHEYFQTHPYSCHLCSMRYSYTSAYNFHKMHNHRPRTVTEILQQVEDFFTIK